jgi:hypothetical protein
MTWRRVIDVVGPVEQLALLDTTWQDEPELTQADAWVAVDAPSLLYPGPPHPGVLLRLAVPNGVSIPVHIGDTVPDQTPEKVFDSELIVGDHGFWLEIGTHLDTIPLACGNYPFQVWVRSMEVGRAQAAALVFGGRKPRRLGSPRRAD